MKHPRPKFLLVYLLLLGTQALAQLPARFPPPAHEPLRYTISLANRDQHIVQVTIRVPPEFPRELQLPVWNGLYQVRDFSQYIQHASAYELFHNPLPVTALDKTTWRVAGDGPFTFEYDIVANSPGPFGAEMNQRHAFFNLAEICAYVVGARDRPFTVSFTGFPREWKVATSLIDRPADTAGAAGIKFSVRNYDELVDSPVEFASFQDVEFEVGGSKYRVVVDADPSDYDLKAIAGMAQKLAVTEVDWMQDLPIDHYVFIYHFPRRPAGDGMEHAYSAAIDASAERVKANPLSLADVTAHEFFHLWNVKRIRPQSLEPVDYTKEQYTRALWFSEGVTSTVADFILVRAGYMDEKGFLAQLAADIRQLESRPARLTQSVEESSLDAWLEKYPAYEQPERSISYYNKGEIVGMMLDLQMRDVSGGKKSLRDLFHWMNQRYARQGKFFPDSDGVREAAEAVTGAGFHDFFAKYVAGVEPIPYDKFFETVGLRLERQPISTADAGFRSTRNAGRHSVVVSVIAGSEAEKAGLRVGDTVFEVNGRAPALLPETEISALRIGDAVELRVAGATGPRKIKFKTGARQVDNYVILDRTDATPAQRARRAAWIRGESQ